MTDHPAADHLTMMSARPQSMADAKALEAGAAALRALAQFRPHHPQAVVGRRYATLIVSYEALRAAQEVLGDFDLGPTDVNVLRQLHDDDRQAHNATLSRDEIRQKWGR
jgi:hypothetical protein